MPLKELGIKVIDDGITLLPADMLGMMYRRMQLLDFTWLDRWHCPVARGANGVDSFRQFVSPNNFRSYSELETGYLGFFSDFGFGARCETNSGRGICRIRGYLDNLSNSIRNTILNIQ